MHRCGVSEPLQIGPNGFPVPGQLSVWGGVPYPDGSGTTGGKGSGTTGSGTTASGTTASGTTGKAGKAKGKGKAKAKQGQE